MFMPTITVERMKTLSAANQLRDNAYARSVENAVNDGHQKSVIYYNFKTRSDAGCLLAHTKYGTNPIPHVVCENPLQLVTR